MLRNYCRNAKRGTHSRVAPNRLEVFDEAFCVGENVHFGSEAAVVSVDSLYSIAKLDFSICRGRLTCPFEYLNIVAETSQLEQILELVDAIEDCYLNSVLHFFLDTHRYPRTA